MVETSAPAVQVRDEQGLPFVRDVDNAIRRTVLYPLPTPPAGSISRRCTSLPTVGPAPAATSRHLTRPAQHVVLVRGVHGTWLPAGAATTARLGACVSLRAEFQHGAVPVDGDGTDGNRVAVRFAE
jgi:hypothetical protein